MDMKILEKLLEDTRNEAMEERQRKVRTLVYVKTEIVIRVDVHLGPTHDLHRSFFFFFNFVFFLGGGEGLGMFKT